MYVYPPTSYSRAELTWRLSADINASLCWSSPAAAATHSCAHVARLLSPRRTESIDLDNHGYW